MLKKSKVNFDDYKLFLVQFGLVNAPDNHLTQDYKLTHELWSSLNGAHYDESRPSVFKRHLMEICGAILGLRPDSDYLEQSMKKPEVVAQVRCKNHHVMGPRNPMTERSMSKDLQSFPDSEPVYEVSDGSLSSCDFKELRALQYGICSDLQLTKMEVAQLQHRYRSFKLNYQLNSNRRDKHLKACKAETRYRSVSINSTTPTIKAEQSQNLNY